MSSRVSGALCALSAAAGFSLVASLGVHATPWPEDFEVTVKMRHLEESPSSYNAIFIGTSEVYRSYVPGVVDRRLAQHGIRMRTFNLAGPGMYSNETDFMLRHALEIEGLELDYVLIQPGDFDPRPKTEEDALSILSNRSVFWHDPRQTWDLVNGLLATDAPLGEKWELGKEHLKAFSYKMTSYGQGRRILETYQGEEEEFPITMERVRTGRGYVALEEAGPIPVMHARRRLLTDNLPDYFDSLAQLRELRTQELDPDAYCREALLAQQELIRSYGAEPIFIVPPSTFEAHYALRMAEEGDLRVVAFNDPDRYAEYFRPESRFDPNHLNRTAATRFSLQFADELAALLVQDTE